MTTDFLSGGVAASLQQRLGNQSTEASSLGSITARLAQPETATETQTQEAVQAADDSVAVDNQAERASDLQAILEQLTADPTDAASVVAALEDLQAFAAEETNSEFGSSVIGQLADIADDVIGAIGNNPEALGQSFAFSFSVDFSESVTESEDFYSASQSLNVSFSINTSTTSYSGDFAFSESFTQTAEGFSYESQEAVSLRLVSIDTNPTTNPLLNQFADLTQELTGVDVLGALGIEEESEPLLNAPVVDVREVPLFKEFFERLNSINGLSEQTNRLLDGLRDSLTETEEAVAA